MANATNSGRMVAFNPHFLSSDTVAVSDPCLIHPGLVEHPLVSPTMQVQILSIVDATGSASIGSIVAAFPCHRDPVGAVFALIVAGVLNLLTPGFVDANSVVTRSNNGNHTGDTAVAAVACDLPSAYSQDAPSSPGPEALPASSTDLVEAALPDLFDQVPVCNLHPLIVVGPGDCRTTFARIERLQRPGVYILLRGSEVYVGYGGEAGFRIIDGRQMPGGVPDQIIGIVDANDRLSEDDAKAYERMLWSAVVASDDVGRHNSLPHGAPIALDRYPHLAVFHAKVVLALREAGLLFLSGSGRDHVAGPICEPGCLSRERGVGELPEGQIMELPFGEIAAFAAERRDGKWLLLAGSQVRAETDASASSTPSYQRAAWQYSGILEPAEGGSYYNVKRDLVFDSRGKLGRFVYGSKSARPSAWRPVDEVDADLLGPAF
jgi:hypothetical protein